MDCPICKASNTDDTQDVVRQPSSKRGYWWYCNACGNQGQRYIGYVGALDSVTTTVQLPIRSLT